MSSFYGLLFPFKRVHSAKGALGIRFFHLKFSHKYPDNLDLDPREFHRSILVTDCVHRRSLAFRGREWHSFRSERLDVFIFLHTLASFFVCMNSMCFCFMKSKQFVSSSMGEQARHNAVGGLRCDSGGVLLLFCRSSRFSSFLHAMPIAFFFSATASHANKN